MRPVLDFNSPVVVVSFVDILQYIFLILSMNLIQIGNSIWRAPGVTIGNPFGRLALGAVTGYEEYLRDCAWASGTMLEEEFNNLARMGYTREQVFATSKYVSLFWHLSRAPPPPSFMHRWSHSPSPTARHNGPRRDP